MLVILLSSLFYALIRSKCTSSTIPASSLGGTFPDLGAYNHTVNYGFEGGQPFAFTPDSILIFNLSRRKFSST